MVWKYFGLLFMLAHFCYAAEETVQIIEPQTVGKVKEAEGKRSRIEGVWGPWAQASKCSVSCGCGTVTWKRVCLDRTTILSSIQQFKKVTRADVKKSFKRFDNEVLVHCGVTKARWIKSTKCTETATCPKDCTWHHWDPWTKCDKTCGDSPGQRSRKRTFSKESANGIPCRGRPEQKQPCQVDPCVKVFECAWQPWKPWGACSRTCGLGVKLRTRIAAHCHSSPENSVQHAECNILPCENFGDWDTWTMWTACVNGKSSRSRKCTNPQGKRCQGEKEQLADCQDCKYSEWTTWTKCTKSCGGGTSVSTREIQSQPHHGGKSCCSADQHSVFRREQVCNLKSCPVDGKWGEWSNWSQCGDTRYGEALQSGKKWQKVASKYRYCDNPAPSNGGAKCKGKSIKITYCSDCVFGQWQEWSACSGGCEGGEQTRRREIQTKATITGKKCCGSLVQKKRCTAKNCLFDCLWAQWDRWSSCSSTCGKGVQTRIRGVERESSHGGKKCPEDDKAWEARSCQKPSCHEAYWLNWDNWHGCTLRPDHCAPGVFCSVRERNCKMSMERFRRAIVYTDPPAETDDGYIDGDSFSENVTITNEPQNSYDPKEHSTAQHSTAHHSTAQPSAAHHSTAQPSTAQPSTAQPSTAQPSTAHHSTAQPSTAQPSTVQPSTAQPSTAHHSTAHHSTAKPSTTQPFTTQHSMKQNSDAQNPTAFSSVAPNIYSNQSKNNANGEDFCVGPRQEYHKCENCKWSLWGTWTKCRCGTCQVSRRRVIDYRPTFGGSDCDGKYLEKKLVHLSDCETGCTILPWSPWSQCVMPVQKFCGVGKKVRTRIPLGSAEKALADGCIDKIIQEQKTCEIPCSTKD